MVRVAAEPREGRHKRASMEPCLFRHGKEGVDTAYPVWAVDASMEPCLFRHGKLEALCEAGESKQASMEPCLFRHGKGRPAPAAVQRPPRFNGAMSFQTW